MDRIRDLASRKRASFPARLPSFSITSRNTPFALSRPKADDDDDDDDAKSNTSSASAASGPNDDNIATLPDPGDQSAESAESLQVIVQTETGQGEVQDQTTSASNAEVSKPKHKKDKNRKKRAAPKGASMEPLEAQGKLFEMAEAAVKQNETLASSGKAVSRRMNELARDVLQANQVIERQDREIAEVNETIKLMEGKLKETQKVLNEARLLVSDTINGDSAQARRAKNMDMVHKITSMTRDVKMEQISTWSKEKTDKALKTLQDVYFTNEESVDRSDLIDAGVRHSACHFLVHGNYDDKWAPMLFHLAKDHDYNAFLDNAREEDHEAASAHHVHYEAWPIAGQNRQESAANKDKQEAGTKNSGTGGGENSKQGSVKMTVTRHLSSGSRETPFEKVCHHPGCNCWMFSFVMMVQWVATLRTALRYYPDMTAEESQYACFAAIMTVTMKAQKVGCVVAQSRGTNRDSMPGVSFLYTQDDDFIKHPGVFGKLQEIAGKLGFDLETWEHDGKAGCRVAHSLEMDGAATERWLDMIIVLEKIFEYEADWCTKDLGALEGNRGESLKIGIRYHAMVFLFEQAETYMLLLGTTFKTCSPPQIREFIERCISSAKLRAGGLLIEHQRRLREVVPPENKQPNNKAAQNDKASQEKKPAQEKKPTQEKKPLQNDNASQEKKSAQGKKSAQKKKLAQEKKSAQEEKASGAK